MVAANGVTARFLASKGVPSLRRVLRTPKKWSRIVALAAQLGEVLPNEPSPVALSQFLDGRRRADPRAVSLRGRSRRGYALAAEHSANDA